MDDAGRSQSGLNAMLGRVSQDPSAAAQREAAARRIDRWTASRKGEAWFAARARRAYELHLQYRADLKDWREECRRRVEQLIADGYLEQPLADGEHDDRTRYEIEGIASKEAVALARRAMQAPLKERGQAVLCAALLRILRRPAEEMTVWNHGIYPGIRVHPPTENTLQFALWLNLPDQPIDPSHATDSAFAKLPRSDRVAIAATRLLSLHAREMPAHSRIPKFDDPIFNVCICGYGEDLNGLLLEGSLNLVEAALREDDGEPPKDLISQQCAGDIAEVTSNTIRNWIDDGSLPAYGDNRQISESELRALLPTLRKRRPRTKTRRRSR